MGRAIWIVTVLAAAPTARADQSFVLSGSVPSAEIPRARVRELDTVIDAEDLRGPTWWRMGDHAMARASVTAERHLVLEVEAGPIALCVSNILDRAWRVEAFEDAARAGTASYVAANDALPGAFTATATLTLDY